MISDKNNNIENNFENKKYQQKQITKLIIKKK